MSTLVIVGSEAHEKAAIEAGAPHVIVVNPSLGGEQVMTQLPGRDELGVGYAFDKYLIGLSAQCPGLRDDLAIRFGDEKCKWFDWPLDGDVARASRQRAPCGPMSLPA